MSLSLSVYKLWVTEYHTKRSDQILQVTKCSWTSYHADCLQTNSTKIFYAQLQSEAVILSWLFLEIWAPKVDRFAFLAWKSTLKSQLFLYKSLTSVIFDRSWRWVSDMLCTMGYCNVAWNDHRLHWQYFLHSWILRVPTAVKFWYPVPWMPIGLRSNSDRSHVFPGHYVTRCHLCLFFTPCDCVVVSIVRYDENLCNDRTWSAPAHPGTILPGYNTRIFTSNFCWTSVPNLVPF